MITAIIPTYNRRELVQRAVESCLPQVEQVIVVDDGSTDDTDKIKWPDKVRCIRLDKNSGVHTARNTGMYEVKTPFFFFLDSDDIVYSNAVEMTLPIIKKGHVAVYALLKSIENGSHHEYPHSPSRILSLKDKLAKNHSSEAYFVLLRREIIAEHVKLNNHKPITYLAPGMDFAFFDMVATTGNSYYLDEYVGETYREIDDLSLSIARKKRTVKRALQSMDGYRYYLNFMGNNLNLVPEKKAACHYSVAVGELLCSHNLKAAYYSTLALLSFPNKKYLWFLILSLTPMGHLWFKRNYEA